MNEGASCCEKLVRFFYDLSIFAARQTWRRSNAEKQHKYLKTNNFASKRSWINPENIFRRGLYGDVIIGYSLDNLFYIFFDKFFL